jgi:hypothetical protein
MAYFLCSTSLITILLLSSGPAYAEWVFVTSDAKIRASMYIDPDTIRHKGNVVTQWELMDFDTMQIRGGSSFLSVKIQKEYDCAAERTRGLAMTEFSGNMGKGKVVSSADLGEQRWSPVRPDTFGETLWGLACNKQ